MYETAQPSWCIRTLGICILVASYVEDVETTMLPKWDSHPWRLMEVGQEVSHGNAKPHFSESLQFSPPKVPPTRTLFFFQPSLGLQKVFQDSRIFWQRAITHPNLIVLHQEGWSLYKKMIKKDFLKFIFQKLTKNLTKNMVRDWNMTFNFPNQHCIFSGAKLRSFVGEEWWFHSI